MAADFPQERKRILRVSGYVRRPGRRSLQELNRAMAEQFRTWLIGQKYAASTVEKYHRIALKLCHHLGAKAFSTVTPMDIGHFITSTLPDRWNDNYIAEILGPLRSFFDFLYLGGVVDSVAPRFLKTRARPKPLPRTLTESEVRQLIRSCEHPRDRALIEFLYSTGCRIGEVLRVRVEDIDFRRRSLVVKGKRRERVVYFGAAAAKSLRAYLKNRASGYLFQDKIETQKGIVTTNGKDWVAAWRDYATGKRGGIRRTKQLGGLTEITREEARKRLNKHLAAIHACLVRPKLDRPMNKETLEGVVREIGRKAGLLRVNPHVLRHSFATHLLQRGADIRAIQELLGHRYLSSTQIYTRVSNNRVRMAHRRFHPRG